MLKTCLPPFREAGPPSNSPYTGGFSKSIAGERISAISQFLTGTLVRANVHYTHVGTGPLETPLACLRWFKLNPKTR